MQKGKLKASKIVAVVAVFAALNVITDSFGGLPSSGVWYSWNFIITPLTGIILGPLLGFAATFFGVMIGHYIYFIEAFEFFFTIGAPIGAAVSGLMFKGKWKPVLIYYVALFALYFATPVAWQLPIWGMWDTYIAFILLIPAIVLIKKGLWTHETKKLPFILAIAAFAGLEADVLFRIILLVPGQTYKLFFDVKALQLVWGSGAIITPIKAVISSIATVAIGQPLIKSLKKADFWVHH